MRNYEDVVIVFFFTTRFGFGFRSFFLRDCSRSRAPRIFFPTRLFPFPGRKRRSKRKKKEKRKEKKEKIRFVASRKLHLSLGIIYRKYYLSNETFFATGTGISFAFSRIDRISVQNDKILPGNVCSVRSYCFRQFFNNNYASKLLNNGTGFLLFFKTPPFFFALEEIHDVCAARNP